jgi:hypothetical protein
MKRSLQPHEVIAFGPARMQQQVNPDFRAVMK